VAAVNGGLIYTSTNSGAAWAATSAPTTNWSGIASSADGAKLVAMCPFALFTSSDFGSDWAVALQSTQLEFGPPFSAVASSSDGTVYFVDRPLDEFRASAELRHRHDQLDGRHRTASLESRQPPEPGHGSSAGRTDVLPPHIAIGEPIRRGRRAACSRPAPLAASAKWPRAVKPQATIE